MDLIGLFRLAFRRWYVFVSVLVAALLIGGLAALTLSPSYEVDGAFRTNFPYASDTEDSLRVQSNPYSDVAATAIVMTSLAQSPDVVDAVAAKGGTARYTVNDPGNAVMQVSVADPNEQNALRTYRILHTELQQRLGALQTGKNIPQQYWVTVDDMTQPQTATESNGARTKLAVAVAVLGVILAFAATVIADHVLRRRADRTTTGPAVAADLLPPEDTPIPAAANGRAAANGAIPVGANGTANGATNGGPAERTTRLTPVPAPPRSGRTALLPLAGPVEPPHPTELSHPADPARRPEPSRPVNPARTADPSRPAGPARAPEPARTSASAPMVGPARPPESGRMSEPDRRVGAARASEPGRTPEPGGVEPAGVPEPVRTAESGRTSEPARAAEAGRASGAEPAEAVRGADVDGDEDWPSRVGGTVQDEAEQSTVRDRRPVGRPAGSDGAVSDLFSRMTRLLDGPRR